MMAPQDAYSQYDILPYLQSFYLEVNLVLRNLTKKQMASHREIDV